MAVLVVDPDPGTALPGPFDQQGLLRQRAYERLLHESGFAGIHRRKDHLVVNIVGRKA
jgi:hypothetical protein